MPRSSAAKKLTANQHNPRHENGLAAPGKRILKKSNGHLDGDIVGKTHPPIASPSSPQSSQPTTLQLASDNSPNGTLVKSNDTQETRLHAVENGATFCEDLLHEPEDRVGGHYMSNEQNHRSIDVSVSKDVVVGETGRAPLALSILRSCPLGDTIGILLILLQIPPAFLAIVHFSFAALTYVPPAGVSMASIPTVNDLFQSSGGTPSMATIVIADICFLAIWLFLWLPAQDFALDLAQAVIAISLGGKSSGSRSVALCLALVSGSHVLRREAFRHSGLDLRWSHLPISAPIPAADPFAVMPSLSDLHDQTRFTTDWIRSMLAVHVLTQGIIKVVRRWLSRREVGQPGKTTRKIDPEAGAIPLGQPEKTASTDLSPTVTTHSSSSTCHTLASEGPMTPVSASAKAKERLLSGKKKRKQGTFVRGQQPLWAALASTKIAVVKEYEQSQASTEASSEATDISNFGSAPADSVESRVWIARVGETDIHFNTSFLNEIEDNDMAYDSGGSSDGSFESLTILIPFYVRVNGARWASTSIRKTAFTETETLSPDVQWVGDIYGLTPLSNYWCDFVRSEDDVVMHSASVTTQPAPAAELATCAPPTTMQQSLRPSSPITTLRTSITATNINAAESQARSKRSRKDHKSSSTTLKKEFDTLKSRVTSSGSSDDRQRQRILQSTQYVRQAEDNAAGIAAETEAMGSISNEAIRDREGHQEAWNVKRENLAATHEAMSGLRADLNRSFSITQADISTTSQKCERLQARHAKLMEQHERATSVSAQDTDVKQYRITELASQEATEQQYLNQVNTMERRKQDYVLRSQQAWHFSEQSANAYSQQQQQLGAAPATPEGDIPGTLPSYSHPNLSRNHGFVFPAFGGSSSAYMRSSGSRARSNSILSTGSGFSEFSDVEPISSIYTGGTRTFGSGEGFENCKRNNSDGGSRSGSASQASPTNPSTS